VKTKRIIATLQKILGGGHSSNSKQRAAIKELLAKLEKKEAKLRNKIAEAKSEDDRERFLSKLEVNLKQQSKGKAALRS